MADNHPEHREGAAQIAPIVRLEEVAVVTGEEDEEVLLELKSKLYRFDKEGNQWKERGTGTVKLLENRETNKVRLVVRQAMTLKICANHLVLSSIRVQEHAGSDKSCVWQAIDFSDGELKEEMFCIRFGSVENCQRFVEMVEEIAEVQGAIEDQNNGEAAAAAGLLENLNVGEAAAAAGLPENVNVGEAAAAAGLVENVNVGEAAAAAGLVENLNVGEAAAAAGLPENVNVGEAAAAAGLVENVNVGEAAAAAGLVENLNVGEAAAAAA